MKKKRETAAGSRSVDLEFTINGHSGIKISIDVNREISSKLSAQDLWKVLKACEFDTVIKQYLIDHVDDDLTFLQ